MKTRKHHPRETAQALDTLEHMSKRDLETLMSAIRKTKYMLTEQEIEIVEFIRGFSDEEPLQFTVMTARNENGVWEIILTTAAPSTRGFSDTELGVGA